jgi:hypothetical protein
MTAKDYSRSFFVPGITSFCPAWSRFAAARVFDTQNHLPESDLERFWKIGRGWDCEPSGLDREAR